MPVSVRLKVLLNALSIQVPSGRSANVRYQSFQCLEVQGRHVHAQGSRYEVVHEQCMTQNLGQVKCNSVGWTALV